MGDRIRKFPERNVGSSAECAERCNQRALTERKLTARRRAQATVPEADVECAGFEWVDDSRKPCRIYSGGVVAQTGNVLCDKVAGLNNSLYVYSVVSTTIPFIEPEKHCERIGQKMAGSAEDIADLDFGINTFVCRFVFSCPNSSPPTKVSSGLRTTRR